MFQDLYFAVRNLRRQPGFTMVAVLALALGIGANTAVFSVIRGVLLRPLPYDKPDQVANVWETFGQGWTGTVSYPNLQDWRAEVRAFAALAGWNAGSVNLQEGGEPERVRVVYSDGDLFGILRTPALIGRVLAPDDEKRDVVVMSHGLWTRRFGADPKVLNSSIRLSGKPYTVVGVMPQGFNFPPGGVQLDFWAPWQVPDERKARRGDHFMRVTGRLRDGVTAVQAEAELKTVAGRLARQFPDEQQDRGVQVKLLSEDVTGYVKPALRVLLGAVGLVLLIACANVANLLLARAAGRERELAVRVALGASRGRLLRLMLTESMLLAILGGISGGVLAMWGTEGLLQVAGRQIPRTADIRFDGAVFAFLLGASLLTGLLFGALPAWHAARTDPAGGLKEGGRGNIAGPRDRVRKTLVIAEMALAFVLLAGAGLLFQTFYSLLGTQSGMSAENVLTLRMAIPPEAVRARFADRVTEKVQAIPGVKSAGMISHLPLVNFGYNAGMQVAGRAPTPPAETPIAEMRAITPGLLEALGVPLLKGRLFRPGENAEGPPALVVNETVAKIAFPNEDPIGKRITVGGRDPMEIIGVVGDVRQRGLDRPPAPEVYFSSASPASFPLMNFSPTMVVKANLPPETLAGAVRAAIKEVDPYQPIYDVKTLERVVSESIADRRLYLVLLALFAGLALVLAMAGIYGVLSYLVTLRVREFGVRIALGASRGDLIRAVLSQGMSLVGLGLAVGLVASFAATRLLESLLYGVQPTDPSNFAAVGAVLGLTAAAACLIPALRATRVDPMVALRQE